RSGRRARCPVSHRRPVQRTRGFGRDGVAIGAPGRSGRGSRHRYPCYRYSRGIRSRPGGHSRRSRAGRRCQLYYFCFASGRFVMAHQWRGVLREYADRLDVTDATPIVTLGEGGTPLIPAPALSARTGAKVFVKFEGMNPTGSFKDRGMTMAVSKAVEHGAKAVICASTGNTSASAAAYATHAGITAAVLVPEGKIAMGKLAQAIAHGAELLQVQGNFDDCLEIARELADNYPVHLVNSVNPDRIEGQKTAAYEVVEQLGDAPDFHFIPVGNAGNYTAYSRGYREEVARGVSTRVPRMFGLQAEGSAPLVRGEVVKNPETVASAIRIGNPASWELALEARDATQGWFGAIDDERILAAQKLLSSTVG